MKLIKTSFFIIVLFVILLSSSISPQTHVLANQILLFDDFSSGNSSKWTEINGTGFWSVINGEYIGSVQLIRPERPAFSFAGNTSWVDYKFELDIKSISGVDKSVLFRFQDFSNTYVLNIRNLSLLAGGNDIVFKKVKNGSSSVISWIPFINYINTWYRLKIISEGSNIKIFIDDSLRIDYTETENILKSGKIGLQVWPGGHTNGDGDITTLAFDNVIISSLDDNTINPIILLPGLGGSWNHEAMILGEEVNQEDWNPTPFVDVYDDIIQTFKNAGYSTDGEEKNLFVFNYDWRKPVDQIAEDLSLFIQNNADGEDIDLVGHSLGGLVARAYVQNNPGNSIDQLITVGSPHKGSPKIYYSWEGGDLKNSVSAWERIPAGIILHLNKPFSKTNKDAVRAIFPGFTNLLPTFNYLKQDGVEKEVLTMVEQNNWLNNLNAASDTDLTDKTTNIVGENIDTLKWIHVGDRNWLEELLDLWPDGKPTGTTETASGDKTVLKESAWINGASVFNLDGIDHRGLIKSLGGQQKIVEILDLSPTEIASSEDIIYEPSLFFQIASPAVMQIEGPNGFQDSSDNLIFVPNAQGNYTLTLVGTDEGIYHLYTGQIGYEKDVWQTYSGTIKNGENIVYYFSFDPQNPSETFLTDSFNLLNNSARTKLVLLKEYVNSNVSLISSKRQIISQINSNIRLIDKGQTETAIINLYKMRQYCDYLYLRNHLAEDKSIYIKNKLEEIISDLEELYIFENNNNSYNQSRLNIEQSTAEKYNNQLKTKLQSDKNKKGANSYLLSDEKLTKAKNSTNYTSHIYSIGAIYLSQEGLKLAK